MEYLMEHYGMGILYFAVAAAMAGIMAGYFLGNGVLPEVTVSFLNSMCG